MVHLYPPEFYSVQGHQSISLRQHDPVLVSQVAAACRWCEVGQVETIHKDLVGGARTISTLQAQPNKGTKQ